MKREKVQTTGTKGQERPDICTLRDGISEDHRSAVWYFDRQCNPRFRRAGDHQPLPKRGMEKTHVLGFFFPLDRGFFSSQPLQLETGSLPSAYQGSTLRCSRDEKMLEAPAILTSQDNLSPHDGDNTMAGSVRAQTLQRLLASKKKHVNCKMQQALLSLFLSMLR